MPLGTAGLNAASVASVLEGLSVRACDWREALASAPEACTRRDSLAALSADAAQPLPAALAPALLPACASALQVLVHVFMRWLPRAAPNCLAVSSVLCEYHIAIVQLSIRQEACAIF